MRQKDQLKTEKISIKQNKSLTSQQRKQMERAMNDTAAIMAMLFVQNQQVMKLNFGQLGQMER